MVLFDKLVQTICDSIEICSNESQIELFDPSVVCYDSKLGTYTIRTISGPIAAEIVRQPRIFSFSFNTSGLEDDTITLTLLACDSDQECPTLSSPADLEFPSNIQPSQVTVELSVIITVSVVAITIIVITVTISVLLALTFVWYKR